ncbi:hypothetical protein, partial [Massilia sp. TSP1-1-2]|uniref:hypothetical protein n=1 Tax=Massilia sp. TSP1-1-2 TaxID=2804649 RepID=UPI003CED1199
MLPIGNIPIFLFATCYTVQSYRHRQKLNQKFLTGGARVEPHFKELPVTPIRVAALLFFTALQVACSRPSTSLDAVPTNKHASATEKISQKQALKISEKQALNLLMSELKARKIESLDCLFFMSGGNP